MTEPRFGLEPENDDDEISFLALGSLLLRWRRTIIGLAVVGAVLGVGKGLTSTRVYRSDATFIPQGSEGGVSGLTLAASQFGIRVPVSSSAWNTTVYAELLRSQTMLERIAFDTVAVREEGGRSAAVMDLLNVKAPNPSLRAYFAIRALRSMVQVSEDKKLGAVRLSVATAWPSVSLALAERLLKGVNLFNLETRKSQAAAERRFVDAQAREAERALREAEDRLQVFLQRNRAIGGSPQLAFENDRLSRDVSLHQQVYTSLLQSREEARIREVRDTPVFTVLEDPRLPVVGEPRGTVRKGMLGGFAGGLFGVLVALLAGAFGKLRRAPSESAQEFFRLLEEAAPRLPKWSSRS